MGYDPAPGDPIQQLLALLKDVSRRVSELERPSGTQTASLVQQLFDIVNGLTAATDISVSGTITAGTTITAGGQISGNNAVYPNGVNSVAVYNTSLTYGGLYKVQYVHQDGTMGYVSSSRRYKQDEKPAVIPNIREIMRAFQIFTFRYIEAVANIGDAAAVEWGPMAEDVHKAGLYWLVEYDEKGRPEGVRHERFAYLAILDAQDKQKQLDAITERLDAAGL